MFKSIFTQTTESTISVSESITALIVAVILGILIALAYMVVNRKEGYQKNFILGLAILPGIVCVVIMLVGSNVARAFSLAGAFALVRFRSAPGTAKDISVVFFSMATGLACGLGFVTFAGTFAVIMAAVLVLLNLVNFGTYKDNRRQLKIIVPENLNYMGLFDDIFNEYTSQNELKRAKTTNMGTMFELTYLVSLKQNVNEKEFIDKIRVRNGNLNVILGQILNQTSEMLN